MDIITTHVNADFDGLASMIAARKLYPGAVLVFAGSADLRSLYGFQKLKTIDLSEVTRLIVVDTRQADRIDKQSKTASAIPALKSISTTTTRTRPATCAARSKW